ncbi:MAG: hypothetical protein ACLFU8_02275 [Anaerolineales bacterium]
MALTPKNTWVLILSGLLAVALVVVVVLFIPPGSTLAGVLRIGALLGYLAVFLASLSSLYLRELTQYFGRSFVKVHHAVSVTALVALTLHAVSAAWQSGTVAVFLPSFASVRSFLALGGRPAFWLIAITSLTALFRASLGRSWRIIHWLNYLAFLLGTIHGQLIGTSFNSPLIRIVSGLMALVLVVVFVVKRVRKSRRRART